MYPFCFYVIVLVHGFSYCTYVNEKRKPHGITLLFLLSHCTYFLSIKTVIRFEPSTSGMGDKSVTTTLNNLSTVVLVNVVVICIFTNIHTFPLPVLLFPGQHFLRLPVLHPLPSSP